jgi:hypothetical protein
MGKAWYNRAGRGKRDWSGSVAAQPTVTYHEAYLAVKMRRRSEVGALQKTASDNNPVSSFIMGVFFCAFGLMMINLFPPIGGVVALVGLIAFGRGVKLLGIRRNITRVLEDEHVRWTMLDSAMERLTPAKFETLSSAVEGQGSYDSVTGWMSRLGLDPDECNSLILAAAMAAEEREEMIRTRSSSGFKHRHRQAVALGHDPMLSPVQMDEDPFDHTIEDPRSVASPEGLHARLLAEESTAEPEPMPAPPHPGTLDAEDDVARKVREARAARRKHPGSDA